MTLSRPRATVAIDGQTLSSAEGAIARLRVSLGFGPAHDALVLTLWPSSKFAAAGAGAAINVALGEAGDEMDVWTGTVVDVRAAADGVVIDGLASTAALAGARLSQTFLDQSVADIVQALVQDQAVDVDEISGDAKLSAYSVDSRRSVWAHVLDLAALVGADVSATAAGKLRVVPRARARRTPPSASAPTSSPGPGAAARRRRRARWPPTARPARRARRSGTGCSAPRPAPARARWEWSPRCVPRIPPSRWRRRASPARRARRWVPASASSARRASARATSWR